MGETVVGFLNYLRNSYLREFSRIAGKNPRLQIVCGNESADLDSVVSAITYAYFSYIKDPSRPFLPVLNILRADLELRRDIVWVLKQRNIPYGLLYFQEDIQGLRNQLNCPIDAVLVDHNDTQSTARELVDSVIAIIDHHEDLGLHKDILERQCGPRIIEKAGSCSSLVYNYWNGLLGPQMNRADTRAPCLGLAALLIDTSNMSYKVEQPDVQAHKSFRGSIRDLDFDEYFAQIRRAKDDIVGLPLRDVLRKDYKEFDFLKGRGGAIRCGMASVVKPLQWLERQFQDQEFKATSSKFLKERNQDVLLILTSWTDDENRFSRQLAFYAETKQNTETVCKLADLVRDKLQLRPIQILDIPDERFRFYAQENTNASRKQVVPYMEEACRQL
ncbi:LADA_0A08306g1_1 [Lachancea dasiensis]|uniref:LADA_0A08306g1_1 n=1 Tax=Lachancea dasiensis TaxID=1072105 RepID=A0A1G4IQL3_9SACH|nr:LADA_0A08306g1_1 [Lachancea dasiensis]